MISWSELDNSLDTADDLDASVPTVDYFNFRIPALRVPKGLLPKARSQPASPLIRTVFAPTFASFSSMWSYPRSRW
jgi:hypothetical protein